MAVRSAGHMFGCRGSLGSENTGKEGRRQVKSVVFLACYLFSGRATPPPSQRKAKHDLSLLLIRTHSACCTSISLQRRLDHSRLGDPTFHHRRGWIEKAKNSSLRNYVLLCQSEPLLSQRADGLDGGSFIPMAAILSAPYSRMRRRFAFL